MRDGGVIVDSDCHQMEPDSMWEKHLEPRYAGRGPVRLDVGGRQVLGIEGEPLRVEDGESFPASPPGFRVAQARGRKPYKRARKTAFSAASRLRDMNEAGVDIQVLNPTMGGQLLGREFEDVELLAACCRAYNDWCSSYCQAAPDRLRWVAMLPLQAPELAVEEVRRAAQLGATAFYARPNPLAGRQLYSADYLPIWSEIEKSNCPLSIHDTGSPRLASFGDRMATHTTGHIIAHPFEAMVAMMSLIWYGIFDHCPELRVVHVECDAGWLPWWLQRMDQHWEFSGKDEHPDLSMAPSEYFRRNIYVTARGDETTLPGVIDQVGDDRLLFHTDYPHSDGTFPWGLEKLCEQPISAESKRKILWENAALAFQLPTYAPSHTLKEQLKRRWRAIAASRVDGRSAR